MKKQNDLEKSNGFKISNGAKVSIVIPDYNEEGCIADELTRFLGLKALLP